MKIDEPFSDLHWFQLDIYRWALKREVMPNLWLQLWREACAAAKGGDVDWPKDKVNISDFK